MKKTLIALMLLAGSATAGLSLNAQAPSCNPGCNPACAPEAFCNDTCSNLPCRPCPFDGLNLTDAQKQQLKALPAPGLSKAEKRRLNKESRANYLKSVKQVLTPEQYVQFLENNFINKPAKVKGLRGGKKDKGPRARFDGKQKAQRGDKALMSKDHKDKKDRKDKK